MKFRFRKERIILSTVLSIIILVTGCKADGIIFEECNPQSVVDEYMGTILLGIEKVTYTTDYALLFDNPNSGTRSINSKVTIELPDYDAFEETFLQRFNEEVVSRVKAYDKENIYSEYGVYSNEFLRSVYEDVKNSLSEDAYIKRESFYLVFEWSENGKWVNVGSVPEIPDKYEKGYDETIEQYLAEYEVIYKHYSIAYGDEAPAPAKENFEIFSIDEAERVYELVDRARFYGLFKADEKTAFDADVPFYPGSVINCYLDETIYMVEWREYRDGSIVTFVECKVSDPSQFRRKLAGEYEQRKTRLLHEMAGEANAVVGLSADFYAFRAEGIMCYDKTVYKYNTKLDTLFVDDNGDFVFLYRENGMSKEELQHFVDDNNLNFSLSFGPVLIEDGVLKDCTSYPIGEVLQRYSRAGIGQMDELHYLFVNVAHGAQHTCTLPVFAEYMYEKGVKNGYNLDGGQTGEIVIRGEIINYIDFGIERTVSDMIYFASALPSKKDEEE